VRIIHLIDPGSPGGGACTLAELAALSQHSHGMRHETVVLGARGHEVLARRCGVQPLARLAIPAHLPPVARKVVGRFIDGAAARGRIEAVMAWSPRSAWLAANAAPHLPLLVRLAIGPVARLDAHIMTWSLTGGRIPLLAGTPAVARQWTRFGAADAVVANHGVNPGRLDDAPREAVRSAWCQEFGIGADDFVVGLIGEPISWPDARMAAEIVARVALAGRKIRLLLHHASARRVEALTLMRHLNMTHLLMECDELAEPWRVMHGLDAALALGVDFRAVGNAIRAAARPGEAGVEQPPPRRPNPSVLPILWACAAGVPIVAHDLPSLHGIIEDDVTGLLLNEHDMNDASDRLSQLHDDPARRRRLGDAAAHMVRDRYSAQVLCDRIEHACDEAVNRWVAFA
jgi:glycosyltransferase involved in cell wall biosynthesis